MIDVSYVDNWSRAALVDYCELAVQDGYERGNPQDWDRSYLIEIAKQYEKDRRQRELDGEFGL